MSHRPIDPMVHGCPHCGARIRFQPKHVGKRIGCPKCSREMSIPAPSANAVASVPVTKPTVANRPSVESDDDWLNLDVAFSDASSTPLPPQMALDRFSVSGDPAQASDDANGNDAKGKKNEMDLEFAYVCKICTAKLHFALSEVGNQAKCPDCYSRFTIPKPSATAKLTQSVRKQSGNESFGLAGVEGTARTDRHYLHNEPSEILRRAERELALAEEGKEPILDAAARNWGIRYFGFVRDGQLCLRALVSGIFLSTLGWFLHYATSHTAEMGRFGERLAMFAAFILLVPFLAYTSAIGFALIDKSANRLHRVREWPPFNPTEWVDEVWMIVSVILLAGAPGSLIGYLLIVGFGMTSTIGLCLIGFTIWVFGPLLILGMMDNGSILKPVSKTVLESLHRCSDAWAAFYIFSSMAIAAMVGMLVWSGQPNSLPIMITGMTAPWLIYFLFHQLGVLAESIGERMPR